MVKIVVSEPDSDALNRFLVDYPQRVSSLLARVEVVRAVRRHGLSAALRAGAVLARTVLLPVNRPVLDVAAHLTPPLLRSLDAVHLASALLLGGELEALVTYDDRLADAARAHGIAVATPGRE